MNRLALCMIVKNEEVNLPKCLDSVKDLVDEIVVLDSGSTDKTVKIAENYRAKIPPTFAWCEDFSAARNVALGAVESEWVLILDADEVLTPEIIPAIEKVIESPETLVVNLIRKEVGASQSPYSLVSRLFRKHQGVKFSRPYHAMIDDSVVDLLKKEQHWQVRELENIAILHYGYQPGVILAENKLQRAQKAMESYLLKNPEDAYVCSKLGALYLELGKDNAGFKLLKQGLKSNTGTIPVVYELQYHLANAYVRKQKLESAVKHYQKAINLPLQDCLKLGAYNNLGGVFLSLEQWKLAQELYQMTLEIDPSFAMGYYNLGLVYKYCGELAEAIKAYQKAIELDPEYAAAYQNLGVAWLKGGNYTESKKAFQYAVNLYQKQDPKTAQYLIKEIQTIGMQVKE